MVYAPNIDILILQCIADARIDSSVIPAELLPKVLKLIDAKTDLSKFTLEEKLILLASMNIQTYIHTIKRDKGISTRVVRDLIPALGKDLTHRQLSAVKKMSDSDMTVVADRDIVRTMEAAYFLQNKKIITDQVRDYTNIRKSKFNRQFLRIQELEKAIDGMVKMISSFKLSESRIMVEAKINQNQYIILIKLWAENSTALTDLMKIISGSQKKKYEDVRGLQDRHLIFLEKIQNKRGVTAILSANGRSLLTNLIIKHL